LYESLRGTLGTSEWPLVLRQAALRADEGGDAPKAMALYREFLDLSGVNGFAPDIRDNYGRLLEEEHRWKEIQEFEGDFLSQHFFENPDNRVAYERSFERLRRAYLHLGIPLPHRLQVPPTSAIAKARSLLDAKSHDEARSILGDLIESEAFRQMKRSDAVNVLSGYAQSIKSGPRVLTVEDWQEVYRTLSILVCDFSDAEGYDLQFARDRAAAANRITKLGGTLPES
jgi:hypothetical protein